MNEHAFNYLAPGGRGYTVTAAIMAGLDGNSRVLEIGCGFGEAACTLAEKFQCHITAVDMEKANIEIAKSNAIKRGTDHFIEFIVANARDIASPPGSFDFIVAEGGVFTAIGYREELIGNLKELLKKDGCLYLTDLVVHPYAPDPVKAFYAKYAHVPEEFYTNFLEENGFRIAFCACLPQRAWDNYFDYMKLMARRGEGFFSHEKMKKIVRAEADIYYNHGGKQGVSYIYLIARKDE